MRLRRYALLVALSGACAGAWAHTDEYLATQPSPNGGQVRMAGVWHLELVVAKNSPEVRENPVVVYVTDHAGAKVPTAGATGTATVLAGKVRAQVTLVPDGDNRMKGYAKYASTPDLKAVVSITIAGKPAEQARFAPLEPKAAAADPHAGHKM